MLILKKKWNSLHAIIILIIIIISHNDDRKRKWHNKKTIKWKKKINHTFTLVYKIYYFVCKIYIRKIVLVVKNEKQSQIGNIEWQMFKYRYST